MTTEEIAIVEEEFVPLPQSQLPQIDWNGIPAYLVYDESMFRHIETYEQIYFALMQEEIEQKLDKDKSQKIKVLRLYKVVNNTSARAVLPMNVDPPFVTGKASARINLPPIPAEMVQKLDDFFRAIDSMYGTESIVLLTWDSIENKWGVLVPEQTNTAAACDYDPASVVAEKPDHVEIVGSAHSHPGMSAFASGTDHKDQATFDGIHITYGWLSKNQNKTEYYIELQIQGSTFVVSPDTIFAKPDHTPSPEIEQWADKVTKKTYATTGGVSNPTIPSRTTTVSSASRPGGLPSASKAKLPADAPKDEATWVGVLNDEGEIHCPFCSSVITSRDTAPRRCLACHTYLVFPGETLEDLLKIREEASMYSHDIDPTKVTRRIYAWERDGNTNKYHIWFEPQGGTTTTEEPDASNWFVPQGK